MIRWPFITKRRGRRVLKALGALLETARAKRKLGKLAGRGYGGALGDAWDALGLGPNPFRSKEETDGQPSRPAGAPRDRPQGGAGSKRKARRRTPRK